MEQIKICKGEEMYGDINGYRKSKWIYYGLIPIFIICSLFGCKIVFDNGSTFMMVLFLLIFLLCTWLFLYTIFGKETTYKPKESFGGIRGTNKKILKTTTYVGIAAIIIICLICYFGYMEEQKIQSWMGYAFTGIFGIAYAIYYTNKSFKVHEDVDFVTSSEIESIVGVEIGEKIQATYQNFDSSNNNSLQDDANLMIVSDKKIYFSFLENGKWAFVKKNINEIVKIGIFDDSYNHQKIHFKLVFSDNTSIMLHMEAYDKATSNSWLFLRKFLNVLDAVVLGTVDEEISSRRRVSVNHDTKPTESQQSENKETRRLDLNNDVIEKLRNATPVESGRVLEF